MKTGRDYIIAALLFILLFTIWPHFREYTQNPSNSELIHIAEDALGTYSDQHMTGFVNAIDDDKTPSYIALRSETEAVIIIPFKVRFGSASPAMVTLIRANGKWRTWSFSSADRRF